MRRPARFPDAPTGTPAPSPSSGSVAPPRIRTAAAAAAFVAMLLTGCASPSVPDDDPTYSGEIVEVHLASAMDRPSTDLAAIVWIKESVDDPCGIRFSIRTDATLFVGVEPGTVADLRPGRTADVWFDGTVAASCPGQAGAEVVRVR